MLSPRRGALRRGVLAQVESAGEVALFGMYVHEFGPDAGADAGRVLVECIDSIPLMESETVRTPHPPPSPLPHFPSSFRHHCGRLFCLLSSRTSPSIAAFSLKSGTARILPHSPFPIPGPCSLLARPRPPSSRRRALLRPRGAPRLTAAAARQGEERQQLLTALIHGYAEAARRAGFRRLHLRVPPAAEECGHIFNARNPSVRAEATARMGHW